MCRSKGGNQRKASLPSANSFMVTHPGQSIIDKNTANIDFAASKAIGHDVVSDETGYNSANRQTLVVENQHIYKSSRRTKTYGKCPLRCTEFTSVSVFFIYFKPLPKATQIASTSKDGVIICPACEEEYCDPVVEEWIQCCECQELWHEECSNYENSIFICDYC
ncbi:hypothetical protein TNCV_418191 [Trichonephila clavipes]|nr:hypothetical protein TNCV_418191 [Trichonephila clavipes]